MWGRNIRSLRERRGLTQAALADAITTANPDLTLDRASISRWESGESAPALRYRPTLAAVLESPYELLFQRLPGESAA